MTYLVPLIIFAAFVALRVMNVLAMRKREAQLRAAWRAEVDATRAALDATTRELASARGTARFSLTLDPLALGDLADVRQFVRESLTALGCAAAVDACVLAVDEVCANLVEHARRDTALRPTRLIVQRRDFDAILVVEDHGPPFDPADAPPPDLTSNWEDRPVGGLGWFLVKQLMDTVAYVSAPTADGQVNRLTLTKRDAAFANAAATVPASPSA